jgi:hypothetical protein
MILQASWTALFNWLTAVNESGNRNIAGFTSAMDFEAATQQTPQFPPCGK